MDLGLGAYRVQGFRSLLGFRGLGFRGFVLRFRAFGSGSTGFCLLGQGLRKSSQTCVRQRQVGSYVSQAKV